MCEGISVYQVESTLAELHTVIFWSIYIEWDICKTQISTFSVAASASRLSARSKQGDVVSEGGGSHKSWFTLDMYIFQNIKWPISESCSKKPSPISWFNKWWDC
jgi:hypothetical protein